MDIADSEDYETEGSNIGNWRTFLLSVALAPKFPYAVILGNDVPTLLDLVQQTENVKPITHNPVPNSVNLCLIER